MIMGRRSSAITQDIYSARRAAGWDFTDVTAVTEINSSSRDADPWVSADLRTIWFSSNRNGDYDIFRASR